MTKPFAPQYIYVADDFTGATDTLATLARAGKRARLFLEVPSPEDVEDLNAFGIATDARALGNDDATALMVRIGAGLKAHRPDILHYKICSTFDSAPETGNFVMATEKLRQALNISSCAIVGGQPNLGRFCAFGNLFARAPDGEIYRIDNHPIMRCHPVTPMGEGNLRAHIARLGGGEIELSNRRAPKMSAKAATLFDVLDTHDIGCIGKAIRAAEKPILCIGASSVTQAVFGTDQSELPLDVKTIDGPVLTFVGSRSAVSQDQVARANTYTHLSIDPEGLETTDVLRHVVDVLDQKKNVLIHIKDGPVEAQRARGIAQSSARLITKILSQVQVGLLAVAGGDTSSAIIKRLAPQSLSYLGDIDPGVPICMANFSTRQNLPVVLKGGQVGRSDLFDHLTQKYRQIESQPSRF